METFHIGQMVIYKDEEHEVSDVDEGYEYLALGGDRYITPNHEDNRCISAPMAECISLDECSDMHLNTRFGDFR
jgi:hypothetical protein